MSVHTNTVLTHIPKYTIMYAIEDNSACRLYLTDGKIGFTGMHNIVWEVGDLRVIDLVRVQYQWGMIVNKNSIANFKYVSAVMPLTIVMQDSKELKIPLLRYING